MLFNFLDEESPVFEERFIPIEIATAYIHLHLVELPNRKIVAFWFAGSKEAAKDVTIHKSVLDLSSDSWSQDESIIDTDLIQHHLLSMLKSSATLFHTEPVMVVITVLRYGIYRWMVV